MKNAFKQIDLSPPRLGNGEQEFVDETFAGDWIVPAGDHVTAFETELAHYVGVNGAVAVNSGTSALHLALSLLNVNQGDTVFCSSLTSVASAGPIIYQKAQPVFIDSDIATWNMSGIALERAFDHAKKEGRLPKAVIIVDLYGQSADKDALMELCTAYRTPVIEDSAEALGAVYKGKKAGAMGKFGVYSFNENKIITTAGGGMLVTNDMNALTKARFLATQACDDAAYGQASRLGYNYRLNNILAAIGRGQLKSLDERLAKKQAIFNHYREAFSETPGITWMPEAAYGKSTHWLNAVMINPKQCRMTAAAILAVLQTVNMEARPVWKPLHLQDVFKECRYYPHFGYHSVSDYLFQNGLCLPSNSNMVQEDQERVIEVIKSLLM